MFDSEESVVFSYRLSLRERNAWVMHCAVKHPGLKPSTVSKLLMRTEMKVSLDGSGEPLKVQSKKYRAVESTPSKKTNRTTVYFTDSEMSAINDIAEQSGVAKSIWISRTIRSAIRFESEPTPKELNNLIDSNKNLLRLGRSFNQIARRLNQQQETEIRELKSIKATIDYHTKLVGRLIKSCVNRWDFE